MKIKADFDGKEVNAEVTTPEQAMDVVEHMASLSDKQLAKYIKQHGQYMAVPTEDMPKFLAIFDRTRRAYAARRHSRN